LAARDARGSTPITAWRKSGSADWYTCGLRSSDITSTAAVRLNMTPISKA
jgi:hypothetical protein